MAAQDSQVPYDPLLDPPLSPRLSLSPGNQATDFGPPQPRFVGSGTANSSASSLNNYRTSEYGSISALKTPQGSTAVLPAGGKNGGSELTAEQVQRYRDDPESTKENLPMRDLSPVPGARRSKDLSEKNELYAAPRAKTKRKALIYGLICAGLVVVVIAVAVPVYLFVVKKSGGSSDNSGSSSGHTGTGSGDSTGQQTPVAAVTTGGDGSTVTKDDGSTFIYNNTFGGFWVYDPANPLNESARAQAHTPPLSEQWKWGTDKIYGVNLGGWLNLEPFISPALYEPFYPNAVDEWTLSELIMARDGNLNAIEEHYKTFITEEDFAMIAAAGLNWVRIPLPFWAIEVYPGEPFLPKTSWTYFLKAIEWARKYGIRINLDLHAIPGSQNGWNHSGKIGQINFMNGVMGLANAQRALDYIRVIAEFISQPEYIHVVPFFGIMNEPRSSATTYPLESIQSFYAEAYRIIRKVGGTGAGNGPIISIHEAFQGLSQWTGFLPGADRVALDTHPYLAFGAMSADPIESFVAQPCSNWGGLVSDSMSAFGMTAAGEWSNAINDCGLYLNAVGQGTRYEGTFEGAPRIGSCDQWTNYQAWDQATKDALKSFSMSTMDALQNWFFWTWRIGESAATGKVETPFWSYKLAIQEGWAPADPREAEGHCASLGAAVNTFTGTLSGGQIGEGTGAGPADLASYPWPPTTIGGYAGAALVAQLPQYTATGALPTLPVPTLSGAAVSATVSMGSGWHDATDTTPMAVPVSGCVYPDGWDALTAAIPACAVPAAKVKREAAPAAGPTLMP